MNQPLQPQADYFAHLAEGRFMLQFSPSTGDYVFYPRVAHPGTGARDLEWVEASGDGVVHAVTTIRPRPPQEPYNVVLVELAEGPRLLSRVEGATPVIGMKLKARIVKEQEAPVLVFDPA
jgi:uncharacterized OB-fold protein